jgi:hypothetical protein
MARRTGGGTVACAGFPARWPTVALGRQAWVIARVRAVPAGFAARPPRVREGKVTGVLKGIIELSGKV